LVVGSVLEGLKGYADFRLMVVTDHATPVELRTHTTDPVPFAVLHSNVGKRVDTGVGFNENAALETGLLQEDCEAFIEEFIGKPQLVS
jgi:2,3-bisphosphoglycerate-independent phosphoglycerate mutase